jgi:hypothetical protein
MPWITVHGTHILIGEQGGQHTGGHGKPIQHPRTKADAKATLHSMNHEQRKAFKHESKKQYKAWKADNKKYLTKLGRHMLEQSDNKKRGFTANGRALGYDRTLGASYSFGGR